jgi:hypothetical protein
VEKTHNELRDLYSLPSIIRNQVQEDEMGRACSTNGVEKDRV